MLCLQSIRINFQVIVRFLCTYDRSVLGFCSRRALARGSDGRPVIRARCVLLMAAAASVPCQRSRSGALCGTRARSRVTPFSLHKPLFSFTDGTRHAVSDRSVEI